MPTTSIPQTATLGRIRRGIVALAVLVAGSVIASGSAAAQAASPLQLTTYKIRDDGVAVPLTRPARGFNLFAQEDIAGTSLRNNGSYRYAFINAGGICPYANSSGDIFNTNCASGVYFGNKSAWGVGPQDYAKILAAWPGAATMKSPVGYSTNFGITDQSPIIQRINAADGQFGQLYAGVTSTPGAGCLDFTAANGASLPANFTLTASSDCPITWAGTGFDGLREIPDSVWLARFNANPAAFRWDDWKIPPELHGPNPMGTDETYGAFSDYPREMVQNRGGVTPHGIAGTPPTERGFPLGLYVRVDAWKYDRPSLRNGVFIRWLVINNSEKVWDKKIDYDKIYFGMSPQWTIVGQRPNFYQIPKLGASVASGGNWSGKCNSTTYPKRIGAGVAEACNGSMTQAPHLILWLKSPLGDLRNKQFSDPTSPYYFPSHQKADDTITFNHQVRGDFGAQDAFTWRRDDRATFGLMSGDRDTYLDGRAFTDFSATQIWRYFRYEFTDGSQSLANLQYNKTAIGNVPGYGKWDYDDDGIQDTLYLPDCGSQGCSGLWGDTIAGGYCQCDGANAGDWLGVGPFALKGGDTTEFLFYTGNATDTLQMNRLITAATTAYFKNFAGASAVPPPTFTAADVQLNSSWFRDSTANAQTAEVRIQVKMPPRVNDPFIQTVVQRLNGADALATNIRNLNPQLIATVTGRMKQNLAQVLVFKSCDLGTSWTNDAGCTAATGSFRTRDQNGTDIGLGWRPLQTLTADSITGVLSNYIISDIVNSGRTYLYSFVTKSRSLSDISVVTGVTTVGTSTTVTRDNLQNIFGFDIDTNTSPLSSSGPSTVLAYAPISVPAGTLYATLDTSRTQKPAGSGDMVLNRLTTTQRSANTDGLFRLRFGNRFILTRTQDTLTNAVTSSVIRQSIYTRASTDPAIAATSNFVAAADTFVANHGFTYSSPTANALRTTPRFITGNVNTFIDTIAAPGYVIGKGSGGTDPYYVAVGTSFTAITQATTGFEGDPWYPGFTATVNAETASPASRGAGSYANEVIRSPGDTLNSTVTGANGVIYVSITNGGLRSSPGGSYSIVWQGDSFGPLAPFRLATSAVLQPQFDQSLAQRPVATYTDTSTTYYNQILALIENTAATPTAPVLGRPLVRARVPFNILGLNGQPAKLVMLQRNLKGNVADSLLRNSRLIGSFGDTTRVSVPADLWMPGDSLWVFENIVTDSTVVIGGNTVQIVHDSVANGRHQSLPIQVTREVLGIKVALQCAANGMTPSRVTCNPLALGTTGSTGYLPYQNGWNLVVRLNRPFEQNSESQLKATPIKASALPLSDADMKQIHVVPNPFVVQSAYDQIASTRVAQNFIKFVNVPAQGLLRIYSVSGQLMQQITWQPTDLLASGNNSPHGDLPYNLRTREGLDLMSGLYLYVLTPTGATANGKVARGKFVVIR